MKPGKVLLKNWPTASGWTCAVDGVSNSVGTLEIEGETWDCGNDDGTAIPTQAEFDQARTAMMQEEAQAEVKRQTILSMRAQMLTDWKLLPPYIKGPYAAEFQLAWNLLDAGEVDEAEAVIKYVEPKSGFEEDSQELATFLAVKTSMGTKFSELKLELGM